MTLLFMKNKPILLTPRFAAVLCLEVCAALFGVSGAARADVLAYEPFAYPAGEGIENQNGGTGFAGAWSIGGALDPALSAARSGSLVSGSLPTSGNSLESNNAYLYRQMDVIAGTPGTTTWLSFLFSLDVSTVDPALTYGSLGFDGISTFDNGAWIGAFVNPANEVVFGIGDLDPGLGPVPLEFSLTPVTAGATYLLAVSVDWVDGGPETVSLFINPPLDGSGPGSAAAVASVDVVSGSGTNRITYLGTYSGVADGEAVVYDEIRFGTSFGSVTAIPEPFSGPLILLGAGLAFLRRHRSVMAR